MAITDLFAFIDEDGIELDYEEWTKLRETSLDMKATCGTYTVSTVFIGMGDQLYETMIFGGTSDYQKRYLSRADAIKGHYDAVQSVSGLHVLVDGEWMKPYSED